MRTGPGRATARPGTARVASLVTAALVGLVGPVGPVGVGPAAASGTAEPAVRITDIGATGSDLRFIATSSGLPEELDLTEAELTVAFEPSAGEAVVLRSTAVPVASSVQVPRQTAILVVDVSGSLQQEGLEDVRDAVDVFLDTVPPEVEVGLVTFEAPPVVRVEPTTQHDEIRDALADLQLQDATALYDAVVAATELLPGVGSQRIVLLTDGQDQGADGDSLGSVAALADAVTAVQASGAELTAIGFREGAPREALQALATAGRGQLVDAAEGDDLDAAFDDAASSFATELEITAKIPPGLAGRRGNVLLGVDTGSLTLTDRAFATLVDVSLPSVEPSATAEPSEVAAPPLRPVPAVDVRLGGPVVWGGLAGLFLALATLAVVLTTLGRRRGRPEEQRQRQLSFYTLSGTRGAALDQAPEQQTTRLGDNAVARSAVQLADRVVQRRGGLGRLSRRLEVADVPLRPAEWVVLQVAAALTAGLLLLLVSAGEPVLALVGLVLGAVGPGVYLAVRGRRRRQEFLRLLPETLGLVASGLRAGYSVLQALEAVVKEGQEPMRGEFNRALVEARLGVSPDDALEGIADRMQSQDFQWVVMAIRIHREVGGNLSEILDTVGTTLRERSRLRRQVDVLSAEGRLSAWIIGLLPVVFTVYLLLTRPEYLQPLVTEPLGLGLLGLGGVLFVAGLLGLRWAVKVEV